MADESTGQVTLVCEASLYRCLGGYSTISQEPPCEAHAPLNKVGMRRYSYFACEASQKLEAAHPRQGGQFS